MSTDIVDRSIEVITHCMLQHRAGSKQNLFGTERVNIRPFFCGNIIIPINEGFLHTETPNAPNSVLLVLVNATAVFFN